MISAIIDTFSTVNIGCLISPRYFPRDDEPIGEAIALESVRPYFRADVIS
jgi:hypothetical protein